MQKLQITSDYPFILIGDSPRLIINLVTQENYIEYDGKRVLYQRDLLFSPDLLEGKRNNVFQTAAKYYYEQACRMVDGLKFAEQYRHSKKL